MSDARPTVALVVPAYNEADYLGDLLAALLPQLADRPHWSLVLVDDSSTDGTATVVETTVQQSRITALHGQFGSPGAARSAGVAAALAVDEPPQWLLTVDADIEPERDWAAKWDETLMAVHLDEAVGAINGVEIQDHLFTDFPNAARVSDAFGLGIGASEAVIGVTNLNGVNHGVRTGAYLTCGPYLQPTAPGPDGIESLAGEDWDLGMRLRRAGYTVLETEAAVRDRGRRLLADVHAYVSGEAYEGAFLRLTPTEQSEDVPEVDVAGLIDSAIERSLRHFLLKPLLAGVPLLDDVDPTLSPATSEAMAAWTARWPHPTFEESRNGFIFGRLARFSDQFTTRVRADLGLDP